MGQAMTILINCFIVMWREAEGGREGEEGEEGSRQDKV